MVARLTPLLLAPALLLSACATDDGGVESMYQPVVQRNDYVLDLQTSGYALAPGEAQRLAGWMSSMRLGYGDHVSVDDGAGGSVARDEVAAQAARYGLLLSEKAPVTMGQIAPETVRVVVTRMTAGVPGCDPRDLRAFEYPSGPKPSYGCATNSNLAAMVADPGDLVRGVPGTPTSDPATGTRAIKALRDATPTGGGGTVVKSESTGGAQ